MKTIKIFYKKIFGEGSYVKLVRIKRHIFKITYLSRENIKMFIKLFRGFISKKYKSDIVKTLNTINNYKNKEYIIFHNPNFLGVTNSTRELFDYLVPCGDIYRKKDLKKISNLIIQNNIKSVYFSAFCYNWGKLIIRLKKSNPNIVIKTYWHGSNSQVWETFGWNRHIEITKLHRLGYIDQMATCKHSIVEFYKKNGFNALFLNNTVAFDGKKYRCGSKNDNIKLGVYASQGYWLKNMMNQIAAAKFIKGSTIDMVPLNKEAVTLANTLNIKVEGIEGAIPRNELLTRMAKNDVNLYVTFSECAPMVPLESLEVGVPCLSGNNHHYFKNTPLEKYLVISNETDVIEIKEKIEGCIKNKQEILELYEKWKKDNDLSTKKQVEIFIGGDKDGK